MDSIGSPFIRDTEQGLSVLLRICRAFSFSIEIFLRKGFGPRYIESNALWSVLLIPCYCMLFEFRRCETMMLFYLCSFVMLFYHRIMRLKWFSRNRGYIHSYYNGRPRLLGKSYKGCEERFKHRVEPILVIMAGIWLLNCCEEPFTWFVTIAGFCMLIKGTVHSQAQKNEIANLRDAMIEQQLLAERLRQWR